MTATVPSNSTAHPPTSDFFADEDLVPRGDTLKPVTVKLDLSPPAPPRQFLQVSYQSRGGSKSSNSRQIHPSQGDVVLVASLDGGRQREIATQAGEQTLPSLSDTDDEDDGDGGTGGGGGGGDNEHDEHNYRVNRYGDSDSTGVDEGIYTARFHREVPPGRSAVVLTKRPLQIAPPGLSPKPAEMSLDLQSVAALGLAAANQVTGSPRDNHGASIRSPSTTSESLTYCADSAHASRCLQQPSPPPPPPPPSRPPLPPGKPHQSPTQPDPLNIQRFNIQSPSTGPSSTPSENHAGELAPMLSSPTTDINGKSYKVPLPSLRSTLGDLPRLSDPNHRALPLPPPQVHYGQQSPPVGINLAPLPRHTSPPISPHDGFRHDVPSPSGCTATFPGLSTYYSHQSGAPSAHYGVEYSSSSATETPGSDVTASASVAERMSIDNVTNPAGTYVCTFAGCKAAPFQTQYLLNSHANVHSSSRPHYCPVKGCPRAEGGKGFKRKNEMIRHGLVHDSPGYVCPFCPDREHKYPRPDNLQRHVRVHHPEKDKDDPALRDVLAQRPDGPSRGRRRRGGQPC